MLVLIQVYMPTSEHDEEEVNDLYERLESMLQETRGDDYVTILGDWNAVVGEGKDELNVGSYELGTRNERGQLLVDLCKSNQLFVTNTWFKQDKRRRCT